MKIVTIYDDKTRCLSTKAEAIAITPAGLKEANNIADQLITTLTPFMPAAGLAAPQIGISKQIFIYSWDRSIEHMVVAINPKIIALGSDTYQSWESCFSTIQDNNTSQAVYVSRAKTLQVGYVDLNGNTVKLQLEGFAAKVFQHEYDHLQGIVDTEKEHSEVKSFPTDAALITFMTEVKKEDSLSYIAPIAIKK